MATGRVMTGFTVTSTQLLEGLRDPDDGVAWGQYVDRYRPPIVRYAQRLGAGREDAEDIAQQTLIAFSTAYQAGQYDRERGRLRDWLFGIARNTTMSWFRRQPREQQVVDRSGATGALARLSGEDELRTAWEEEWRDAVLRECLGQVRREVQPGTYEAFELFAVRGWSADRVAEHLGITPNAVFGAKRRVLERIRTVRPAVEDLW